jgi:GNAT superfamily N-acetyltransferase
MKRFEAVANTNEFPNIHEIREGEDIRFEYKEDESVLGRISLTLRGPKSYDVGGLFVDPAARGRGVGSSILQKVKNFLDVEKAKGTLVNMVQGDAASIYTNNGWTKTEYKSHGAYGGYQYVYDAREQDIDVFPRIGYCYSGVLVAGDERKDLNVIFRGPEKDKYVVFDGKDEYLAARSSTHTEEPVFEFATSDLIESSESGK